MRIYQKQFASIYDKVYGDKFYKDYAIFVKDIAKEKGIKNIRVFDIGCGTGRLISKFGKKIKCEGMDISEDMIKIAKKRNKNAKFYIQNFVDFNTGKKYNIVVSTFDTINYITNNRDIAKFFKNVKRHLKENGVFIFDFNTIYKKIEKKIIKPNITYINQIKNRYWFITIKIKNGKKIKEEKHIERLYSFNEIKQIISKAGFGIVDVYSDFKNKARKINRHKRLIVVLRKY